MIWEIMVGVFKVIIGLFIDKGCDWLVEKLREGDVMDEIFWDLIVWEINVMNLKLDVIVRKDFGVSMNFLMEGFVLMYKVFGKVDDSEDCIVYEVLMKMLDVCFFFIIVC